MSDRLFSVFFDIPAETLVRLNQLYDIDGTVTEAEAQTWGPSFGASALQISEEQTLRWFRWRSNVSSSQSPAPLPSTSQHMPLYAPPAALRSFQDIKEEFYQHTPGQPMIGGLGATRQEDGDNDELMSDDSEARVKMDLDTPTATVHFGDQLPTPSATTSPEPSTWAAYPEEPPDHQATANSAFALIRYSSWKTTFSDILHLRSR